ncbi:MULTISPECIES: acyl-CoA dehydrogenase family protein [Acidianus]|uniref:Acyl-CoA dehydrogenase n=1 Tax=Candidatus Acidianus copahuensis TaxID=1160895 RepID=A0A031LTZ1_9CREN|nr:MULTISPECIES: acyl-CoA dehydrogenase family protein [Acidianus]EZQ11225.1 acyl-CoA dehydrogenase [Candidatus Acidianus copahuensis]NON62746.1 acyl-CoA dehydrogenase [Acidianus sp. RZ1]
MVLPFSGSEAYSINVNQNHEIFRKSVREFMENYVSPQVERGEKEGKVPDEVLQKAKELGLYGIQAPEKYGGQGGDMLMVAIAQEEMTRVWPSFATRISIGGLYMSPILLYGTEEQKVKYVTPVAKGEKEAAFANTEPVAGSDVSGIRTVAKKVGNKYIINGKKIFITNGGYADYFVVTARTSPPEPNARWKGISMFIVEKPWKGVKVESRIETIGLKASYTAELLFDDVEVPESNLIGEEGMGFKYAMAAFDRTRVGVAAQGVGAAQGALEKMVTYSMQRSAFENSLINFQMVQEKISESLTEVNAARLLTYWAASLFDKGEENEAIIAASMAKFFSTEVAEKVAIRAITIHGGYGVSASAGVERYLRDVEVMKIYEGTNDIQKLTILKESAKRLLGLRL